MRDSFIELECDVPISDVRSPFSVRPLDHRNSTEPSGHVPDIHARPAEGDPPGRLSSAPNLWTVARLYDDLATGLIGGLPGSGKTTILRRLAFLHLEAHPRHVVLFARCRDMPESVFEPEDGGPPAAPIDFAAAVRILAVSALRPDLATPLHWRTGDERDAMERAIASFLRLWNAGRAMVLVDALDEAPSPQAKALIGSTFHRLANELRSNPTPPGTPTSRAWITARLGEWRDLQTLGLAQFDVRPLRFANLQRLGKLLLSDSPALAEKFVDTVAQDPVAQSIGGTPLTATLLIHKFKAGQRFDLRYASYDSFCRFVLSGAWNHLRLRETTEVIGKVPPSLEGPSPIEGAEADRGTRLYSALSRLCYDCLYKGNAGESEIGFGERSIEAALAEHLGNSSQPTVNGGVGSLIRELRLADLLVRSRK